MEKVDITIIGAGVIGLAIASEVSNKDRNVFILEKNSSWGQEASSRNSEVIHAGIYYPKGSLKAKACYEGRNILYSLCKDKGIGVKKTGKLIVAVDNVEVDKLEEIKKTASLNGVELTFLEKDDIKKMEPAVSAKAALYSPETGIVDSHNLMKHFISQAQSNGAELVCEAKVIEIKQEKTQYKIKIDNQGEIIEILSTVVINCAGNNSDEIAKLCGIDVEKEGYKQYYLKGNYFRLSDKYRDVTKHLVYPVPKENSLGIHTVLDLSGGIRLGPDEEKVEKFDYQVDEDKKNEFYQSVRKFLPAIEEESLSVDMAGIRPQLKNPNFGDFKDFIISHETDKGLSGLINLIGIESPGLTASPYIGKFVAQMVDIYLNSR